VGAGSAMRPRGVERHGGGVVEMLLPKLGWGAACVHVAPAHGQAVAEVAAGAAATRPAAAPPAIVDVAGHKRSLKPAMGRGCQRYYHN
jgi:hypothetical protein